MPAELWQWLPGWLRRWLSAILRFTAWLSGEVPTELSAWLPEGFPTGLSAWLPGGFPTDVLIISLNFIGK